MILPARETERLIQVIVLARSWPKILRTGGNVYVNHVGIAIVADGGVCVLNGLAFSERDVEITIDDADNPDKPVEAPYGY